MKENMAMELKRNWNNFINVCADRLVEPVAKQKNLTPKLAKETLERWLDGVLVGTEIGAVLLNVCYNVSLTESQVWDTAWRKVTGEIITYDQLAAIRHWHKDFVYMKELGIDLYQIACSHLRKRGVAPWISVRMNEFHYLKWKETAASFWMEHPEYRLAEDAPFDYSYQEVRNYYLIYIEEQCRQHDIDGIELDMLRGDQFFPEPVTDDKVKLLNDFLCQVRQRVDVVAQAKQHPIRISVRCYPQPEDCWKHGWDPVTWVTEGAVDVLTIGNFFVPTCYDISVERWREMLLQAGVSEEQYWINAGSDYGNFAVSYDSDECRCQYNDTASMKGFAAMAFERGADGIYTFNLCLEENLDWSAFGSLGKAMEGMRRHILTTETHGRNGVSCSPFPVCLFNSEECSYELYTAKRPRKGEYLVRIGLQEKQEDVEVMINGKVARQVEDYTDGQPYSEEKPQYGIVRDLTQIAPRIAQFRLDELGAVCDGVNCITLRGKGMGVTVLWLEVAVTAIEGEVQYHL